MIALINAGGSGSRLWPLSTPDYPKHLLKIGENGGSKTLIQATYERVSGFADDVYFITEAGHAHHVKEQLPHVDDDHIIIEPARRGTASCLLLALNYLRKRHDTETPIVMMQADHVIRDVESLAKWVQYAARTSVETQSITLLGIEPTYASTGFGYIERGEKVEVNGCSNAYTITQFKEKPDRQTAENWIRKGNFLWNMGSFAAPLSVFEETMKQDAPELYASYQRLAASNDTKEAYLALENIAIDYALIEPASTLHVVPGNFDWIDVGSYQDLHTIAKHDEEGNAKAGNIEIEGVSNSYLHNDTDTNVAVIGLDNVVVVMTDKGLVVANRNHSQKIGPVSKRFLK